MDEDKTKREDLDSTETARPHSPPLPERVGPYRILERLGEGGMGVVYLAEQTESRASCRSARSTFCPSGRALEIYGTKLRCVVLGREIMRKTLARSTLIGVACTLMLMAVSGPNPDLGSASV